MTILRQASFATTIGKERDVEPRKISEEEARALAIYTPKPRYPYEARARWLTGRGLVLLIVNPRTGYVTSERIWESTGHKILDDAALEAFRQWQFKPGRVDKVKIPITFTMSGVPLSGRALAVYAARPQYPAEARSKRWTGTGIVRVDVDRETGQVTSARMLQSTGHQILDEAALNAFRQWRFRPGTVSHVQIPITFTMTGAVYARY
jgi:TonB family protein